MPCYCGLLHGLPICRPIIIPRLQEQVAGPCVFSPRSRTQSCAGPPSERGCSAASHGRSWRHLQPPDTLQKIIVSPPIPLQQGENTIRQLFATRNFQKKKSLVYVVLYVERTEPCGGSFAAQNVQKTAVFTAAGTRIGAFQNP